MTNPDPTPLRPADVFMHLIVTYLTPLFLSTTGGNVEHARMAAIEAVNAYAARNQEALLAIAQIIAFGLAILDSLNRSMEDDLPLTLVLRPLSDATPYHPTEQHDPETERLKEEAVLAGIARARQRLAEFNAAHAPEQPAATPQPAARPANPIQTMLQAALHAPTAASPNQAPPESPHETSRSGKSHHQPLNPNPGHRPPRRLGHRNDQPRRPNHRQSRGPFASATPQRHILGRHPHPNRRPTALRQAYAAIAVRPRRPRETAAPLGLTPATPSPTTARWKQRA
jgi:hypothetical protein